MAFTGLDQEFVEWATARMPRTGEVWRRHDGTRFKIIGIGNNSQTGEAMVAYTEMNWPFGTAPQLWFQRIDAFLGVECGGKRSYEPEESAPGKPQGA